MYTKIAVICLVICSILIIVYVIKKHNNVINSRDILRQHFELIKTDRFTFCVFFIVPIIMGAACAVIRLVSNEILSIINIVLPIYIGLQFSVAGILCDMKKGNDKYEKIKESAFNEILFESILSILSLVISFIITFIGIERIIEMVLLIMSGLLYILVLSTILNTFIVLKRLKFLFDERN